MDFGLSSGEDTESEKDEPPEGFTAAVLEDRAGWAELAHSSNVLGRILSDVSVMVLLLWSKMKCT